MNSLYDLDDVEIAAIVIGGALIVAGLICLSLCAVLHCHRRHLRRRRASSTTETGGSAANNGALIIKGLTPSVVHGRHGHHPIAFVLPTVSMSEPGSEFSDMESLSTTYSSTSPAVSTYSPSSAGPASLPIRPALLSHMHQRSASLSVQRPFHPHRRRYSPLVPERGVTSDGDASDLGIAMKRVSTESHYRKRKLASRSKSASPRPEDFETETALMSSSPFASAAEDEFGRPSLLSPVNTRTSLRLQQSDSETRDNSNLGQARVSFYVDCDGRIIVSTKSIRIAFSTTYFNLFFSQISEILLSHLPRESEMIAEKVRLRLKLYPSKLHM